MAPCCGSVVAIQDVPFLDPAHIGLLAEILVC